MGTNSVLKWNLALEFEFSIQSSVYGATTVAKVSVFSYASVEVYPFSCEQT